MTARALLVAALLTFPASGHRPEPCRSPSLASVLDHADDYSWFISADPTFNKLWIYTREVPNADQRQRLVARAQALGYDVSRLEFPAF